MDTAVENTAVENTAVETRGSPGLFAQAVVRHRQGELDAAAALYALVLQKNSGHADALHLSGVIDHQRGAHAQAVTRIRQAIRLRPREAAFHYNLGNAQRALGALDAAAACYREAVRLQPDYAEAHYNLGILRKQQARLAAAAGCFRQALRHRPDYVEALNNLGTTLRALGEPAQAEPLLRRALALRPDSPELHNNLGLVLRDLGREAAALVAFADALAQNPEFFEARRSLAGTLVTAGRHAEAASCLQTLVAQQPQDIPARLALAAALRESGAAEAALAQADAALALAPDSEPAQQARGECLRKLGRAEEAEALFRALVQARPQDPDAWNDLGNPLRELGRLDDSAACYRRALALRGNFPEAHANLGNVLKDLGRVEAARASLAAALRQRPDYAEAHFNLATLHLLAGEWEPGWRAWEWRFRCYKTPPATLPRWDGAPLAGRTLLVQGEQGLGDTIQFARLATLAAVDGPVVLQVDRSLLRLFTTLAGVTAVVAADAPPPPAALHCPLMSLPLALRITPAALPAAVPYLHAAPAAAAAWRARVASLPGMRVGLVWAGNPAYPNDRHRSMPLAALAPLALPGVQLVSLQKHAAGAPAPSPPTSMVLHDWTDELSDFSDTAALMAALDLVISVDTAAVHLAGALGRPVWLLNRFDTCWRWMLGRDDSPWYPTLRQFRQPSPGDWDSPVCQARAALAQLVAAA
jgi:tetratricopeptide (TPR) repeat protein